MDTKIKWGVQTYASLPQIVKRQSTYKLVVPEKVEEKIRYLIRKYPSTEWSGVLFYTHTGNFEDGNLVIMCEDLFPMDLGTSTWTEFKMTPDVSAYIADNIDLIACDTGLIHSHHGMGAFFSGQDDKMLQQEGNDTNCFVSLVVDTKGTYVAAVTRKVQEKSEITTKSIGSSYQFFGDGPIQIGEGNAEKTEIVNEEYIECFLMQVERHPVDNGLEYLDRRFEEIVKSKKPVENPYTIYNKNYNHSVTKPLEETKVKIKEPTLWSNETMKSLEEVPDYTPDPELIHNLIVHMVTCSLIVNPAGFDLKQWVIRHMEKKYKEIFYTDEAFNNWSEFIVEHLLLTFNDPKAPSTLYEDMDLFESAVAKAAYEELSKYSEYNVYIMGYCDILQRYIFAN